ncbi:MAG: DUF2752 domain-containing protein [Vicinamibacteria bacterium]|nr:DUF2752 domain-containing protein [Vicinamibacteria bacterium]
MTASSFGIAIAPRQPDRLLTGPMTLAGLALAACVATRIFGLDYAGVTFCYFKALTGHACFTCGTTRAMGHLARFDLPAAFAVQPLVTVGTLALLFWGALDGILLAIGKRTAVRLEGRALARATALVAVLAVLNWIYLLNAGV